MVELLNRNKERDSSNGLYLEVIGNDQLPNIKQGAIDYILGMINEILDNPDGTNMLIDKIWKDLSFVGTQLECVHDRLVNDSGDNFYKTMIETFAENDFEIVNFEIGDTANGHWAITKGHIQNTTDPFADSNPFTDLLPYLDGFDVYTITMSNGVETSSNLFQTLMLTHEMMHVYMLNSLDNWGYIVYDDNDNPKLNINCVNGIDYSGLDLNWLTIQQRFVAIICAFMQNNTLTEQWLHELFNVWTFDITTYRDKIKEILLNNHD